MGVLAIATVFFYNECFDLMRGLMSGVARSEEGYFLFNIGSNLMAALVMFPAAFCAGTTLPLITYSLLRKGYGERSIGTVYAANTVGAITGVFFSTHIGLPLLGLKGLILRRGWYRRNFGLGSVVENHCTPTGLASRRPWHLHNSHDHERHRNRL